MSATIRDPSAQSPTDAADPRRYQHRAGDGSIEVEETSGVVFAEATGRAGVLAASVEQLQRPVRKTATWLTLALVAGGFAGWITKRRKARRPTAAVDAHHAQLDAMARHAADLIGCPPADEPEIRTARPEAEQLRQVIDAQGPLLREGEAAPLSEPLPDAVPMTGEEDPIVELDDPGFAEIVAEFMQSERDATVTQGDTSRTRLARALLPFADLACEPAAVARAIDGPFAEFAASLATGVGHPPHAADRLLVETLISIAGRAGERERD